MRVSALWVGALSTAALCACSIVPSNGPTAGDLTDSIEKQNDIGIKFVDLTPAVATLVSSAPAETMGSLTMPGKPVPDLDLIGIGDVLAITIFEAGPGLFPTAATEQRASSGSRPSVAETSLPRIVVNGKGEITVPFVGQIVSAGLTPSALQTRIEARLKDKAMEPQVLVSVEQNVANTVVISGDVKTPGRYPLSLAHESLLDLIAQAAGPLHTAQDVSVRLTRGGQQRTVRLSQIIAVSSENIALAPHDRIELIYAPRTYTAYGAAGKVMQVPFDSGDVSLADALARAGGPFDQLADPSGIYLFRFERPESASALGLPPSQSDPVVYHIDLREAQSYFTIQQFAMRDKDVIFVASARTNALQKLFALMGSIFSPAAVSRTLAQ